MTKISRIQRSRREWKIKAVSRATQLRRQRKKSVRSRKQEDARRLELEERINFLECENAAMKSAAVRHLPAVIGDGSLDQRRTACVTMVIEGTVSFRAVPRIWGVLQRLGWVQIQIPHFTSVIHWTLRAGMTLPSPRDVHQALSSLGVMEAAAGTRPSFGLRSGHRSTAFRKSAGASTGIRRNALSLSRC